jgi:hypothetical protein
MISRDLKSQRIMAPPARFELTTLCLEGTCSLH